MAEIAFGGGGGSKRGWVAPWSYKPNPTPSSSFIGPTKTTYRYAPVSATKKKTTYTPPEEFVGPTRPTYRAPWQAAPAPTPKPVYRAPAPRPVYRPTPVQRGISAARTIANAMPAVTRAALNTGIDLVEKIATPEAVTTPEFTSPPIPAEPYTPALPVASAMIPPVYPTWRRTADIIGKALTPILTPSAPPPLPGQADYIGPPRPPLGYGEPAGAWAERPLPNFPFGGGGNAQAAGTQPGIRAVMPGAAGTVTSGSRGGYSRSYGGGSTYYDNGEDEYQSRGYSTFYPRSSYYPRTYYPRTYYPRTYYPRTYYPRTYYRSYASGGGGAGAAAPATDFSGLPPTYVATFANAFNLPIEQYYTAERGGATQATRDYQNVMNLWQSRTGKPMTPEELVRLLTSFDAYTVSLGRNPGWEDFVNYVTMMTERQVEPLPQSISYLGMGNI